MTAVLLKESIEKHIQEKEDEKELTDKAIHVVHEKIQKEWMEAVLQEGAKRFSDLAKRAKLEKDFGDQLTKIEVEEQKASKEFYENIGKEQLFRIEVMPMRELTTG